MWKSVLLPVVGLTMNFFDLRKHSIKDTGGRSRKKQEDPRRAYMKRLIAVGQAKEVCRGHSVLDFVLSDYYMYVLLLYLTGNKHFYS